MSPAVSNQPAAASGARGAVKSGAADLLGGAGAAEGGQFGSILASQMSGGSNASAAPSAPAAPASATPAARGHAAKSAQTANAKAEADATAQAADALAGQVAATPLVDAATAAVTLLKAGKGSLSASEAATTTPAALTADAGLPPGVSAEMMALMMPQGKLAQDAVPVDPAARTSQRGAASLTTDALQATGGAVLPWMAAAMLPRAAVAGQPGAAKGADDSLNVKVSAKFSDALAGLTGRAVHHAGAQIQVANQANPVADISVQNSNSQIAASAQPFVAALDAKLQAGAALPAAEFRAALEAPVVAQLGADAGQLAAMQSALGAQATPATSSAVVAAQTTVATPFAQPAWADDFSQKVTWVATQNLQSAELHLNPPQLGPLDVSINISGDQATAQFASPHQAVRDAIEQALPKLRDMLANNGIMLGQTSVGDQSRQNNRDNRDELSGKQARSLPTVGGISDNTQPGASLTSATVTARRHNGMLDTFA